MALGAALALAAACAQAAPPLLPGSAFARPSACTVDPFHDPSLGERERLFDHGCGLDRLRLNVATPRLDPVMHTGPNRVELEVDKVMTRRFDAGRASARVGWSGGTDDGFGRLQPGRALIAAGGTLKLDDRWAIDVNAGSDIGNDVRSRATMAGLWRPRGEHLLVVQVAAEHVGVANAVGLRWWLKPGVAALDVSAQRSADGQTIEPRLALKVIDFVR